MPTLVLRLAGPMQSYGGRAAGGVHRSTGDVPTKSAVTGVLASAYGYDRNDPRAAALADTFEMSVRVERAGTPTRDYHTATPFGEANAVVTERWYLADAVFLAFLQFDDEALATATVRALRAPVFTPFLGRKTCVPEQPIVYALSETPAADLLTSMPQAADLSSTPDTEVELVAVTPGGSDIVRDVPTGGGNFQTRTVTRSTVRVPGVATAAPMSRFHRGQVTTPRPQFQSVPLTPMAGELTRVTVPTGSVFGFMVGNRHRLHGYVAGRAPDSMWSEEVSADGDWLRITISGNHEAKEFPGAQVTHANAPERAAGERVPFIITVNPTRQANGRRRGITEAREQLEWLNTKIDGARLTSGRVVASRSISFDRKGAKVSVLVARLEGELEVTDPTAFAASVTAGFGRAKAYGCGLLLAK